MSRTADWLEERLGYRKLGEFFLSAPVPAPSRWGRSFGGVILALLVIEAVTGIGLALYYAPTTTGAWASVAYIQNQVALGWLLRGLHHFGATAIVIAVGGHLLSTLVFGTYRAPRELTWISGVLSLVVLLIASHTGYLLPGDLRGYWATQVLLEITANQPMIGEFAKTLVQGGPAAGNVTFTHFYAAHVLLFPGLLIGLAVLHIALRGKHGAAPDFAGSTLQEPYALRQWPKDVVLAGLAALGLFVYVVANHGAPLFGPADTAVEFLARPEWYFLPIFELRHFFTGDLEFIATGVIPTVAIGFLCAVPFMARMLGKVGHTVVSSLVLIGLLGAVLLGAQRAYQDETAPGHDALLIKNKQDAEEAFRLAALGVPVEGPQALYKNDPVVWGKRVFAEKCETCHQICSKKPYKGDVCLEGYATRTWLTKFLRAPASIHFFGNTKIDEMDAFTGSEENLRAIVEFLYSQGNRADANATLAEKGHQLYVSEGCESCHSLDGVGTGDAPDLKGYASEAWLSAFIRLPGHTRFYGELNKMDDFPFEKLSADELRSVVAYLRAQSDADAKFP